MRKAYKYLKWLFVLLFYAILYIVIYAVNMSVPE